MTHTNHYDGDGDNPSWTQESSTAWTRNISGIGGDLVGIYDSASGTTSLQLTNLHGDVVGTASTSSAALAPTAQFDADEFGVPRGATGRRYGWLGAKQRAADTPGGLSLMGARLYNPSTGRFLQVDPVWGGSANAYDYAMQDPINVFDLDGRAAADSAGCSRECEARATKYYKAHPLQTIRRIPDWVKNVRLKGKSCGRICRAKKKLSSAARGIASVAEVGGQFLGMAATAAAILNPGSLTLIAGLAIGSAALYTLAGGLRAVGGQRARARANARSAFFSLGGALLPGRRANAYSLMIGTWLSFHTGRAH